MTQDAPHRARMLSVLGDALASLESGFTDLPRAESPAAGEDRMRQVLMEAAERLRDNYPYFHPLYAGQMLKPPHPVARLAYALAQSLNPNNHALDGGRASSLMEKEAVAEIAAMIGWTEHLGHLCGGGTIANSEALWVAGHLRPGQRVVASEQAHYTHQRISGVWDYSLRRSRAIREDAWIAPPWPARWSSGDVGCVVATVGTTAPARLIPCLKFFACASGTGSVCTWTPRTAAILCWPTILTAKRAPLSTSWARRIRW